MDVLRNTKVYPEAKHAKFAPVIEAKATAVQTTEGVTWNAMRAGKCIRTLGPRNHHTERVSMDSARVSMSKITP